MVENLPTVKEAWSCPERYAAMRDLSGAALVLQRKHYSLPNGVSGRRLGLCSADRVCKQYSELLGVRLMERFQKPITIKIGPAR